jgi:hypothetical protein
VKENGRSKRNVGLSHQHNTNWGHENMMPWLIVSIRSTLHWNKLLIHTSTWFLHTKMEQAIKWLASNHTLQDSKNRKDVQNQNEQEHGECFSKPQLYDVSSFIKDKT